MASTPPLGRCRCIFPITLQQTALGRDVLACEPAKDCHGPEIWQKKSGRSCICSLGLKTMGFRHFWENPHYNIFSEARAAPKNRRNIIFFATLIFSPSPFAMKKAFSSRPRSEFFEQYNGVGSQFLGKFCAHISAPPPNSFAHSSPHGAILKARPIRTHR